MQNNAKEEVMGVYSELDTIFRYGKDPVAEATQFFSTSKDKAFMIASKEYDKWLKINSDWPDGPFIKKEEDMGRYVGRPVWWVSDNFAFFADWLMRDLEKHEYTWEQIAKHMKTLAVTPHKYKGEYDRWMAKNEELESLVDNNPDDGSWEGR